MKSLEKFNRSFLYTLPLFFARCFYLCSFHLVADTSLQSSIGVFDLWENKLEESRTGELIQLLYYFIIALRLWQFNLDIIVVNFARHCFRIDAINLIA